MSKDLKKWGERNSKFTGREAQWDRAQSRVVKSTVGEVAQLDHHRIFVACGTEFGF